MSVAGKGGRPLGLPKTGGRKKGTPNKATAAIAEKLDGLRCDPIAIIVEIAQNKEEESTIRLRAAIELCSYVYPKRAPITDLSQTDRNHTINISTEGAPVGSSSPEKGDGEN
ncbi:MAG TPA: hypothetical protein VFI95_15375 [Terriglobales bacterium]|nr:hypothetical protein [Terriglobales bacterium]